MISKKNTMNTPNLICNAIQVEYSNMKIGLKDIFKGIV